MTSREPAAPYVEPGAAAPRYQPMIDLPAVNIRLVSTPPAITSRQSIGVSGSTLKSAPNNRANKMADINVFNVDSSSGANVKCDPTALLNAVRAVLAAKDTISRKPS